MSATLSLSFKLINAKTRFLDRDVAKALNPVTRRFFMRAGAAIRLTARRSLRMARRKKLSELTPAELDRHKAKQRYMRRSLGLLRRGKEGAFDEGLIDKSKLPQVISRPGQPPVLHSKDSLLKTRLFFALSRDSDSVVIGPELIGRNKSSVRRGGLESLSELERRRPFMNPAYEAIEPRFPEYLRGAARL